MDYEPGKPEDVSSLVGRMLKQLEKERRYVEPVWQNITDYMAPSLSNWGDEPEPDATAGELVFDGTGVSCLTDLADGICSWLVSEGLDWLQVAGIRGDWNAAKSDVKSPISDYANTVKEYLYTVFSKSNFYDAVYESIRTGCSLGTSVVMGEEGDGRPMFSPLHPKEGYVSENKNGDVDTLLRKFLLTARQAMEVVLELTGSYDSAPKELLRMARSAPEDRARLLHAIYPRKEYAPSSLTARNKPYASVYMWLGSTGMTASIARGKSQLIHEGGLSYLPFAAWRFRHLAGQCYGTCPPMDAYYDVRTLNLMAETLLDSLQMAATPPMYAIEGLRNKLKIKPRGVTYGPAGGKPEPIVTSMSLQAAPAAIEWRSKVVRQHFKTDFFQSISQIQEGSRDRTATEIMQIKAESAAAIGPIIGRAQRELIERLVRLTIILEKEAGRLPQPPESVQDMDSLGVEIVGPLAVAQRRYIEVNATMTGLSAGANVAQALGAPTTLMNLNVNRIFRKVTVAAGLSTDDLIDEKKVAQAQAAAAQAASQAAEQEQKNAAIAAESRGTRAIEKGSIIDKLSGGAQ